MCQFCVPEQALMRTKPVETWTHRTSLKQTISVQHMKVRFPVELQNQLSTNSLQVPYLLKAYFDSNRSPNIFNTCPPVSLSEF